jgi:tRNA (guanosine-2'-O-)-methyltransferase
LLRGDTLRGRRPCIHWVAPTKEGWIAEQQAAGRRIVAVELAEGATPLPLLVAVAGSLVAYRLAGLC